MAENRCVQMPGRKTRRKLRSMSVEEINMEGNAEQLEYFRAARGEPYPVPPDLYSSTEDVQGRDFIIARAVRAIWDYNKHRRIYALEKGYQPAVDVIAHGMGLDPERATLAPRRVRKMFFAMLGLTLAVARQSTRYWGVDDPTRECYCSECRGAKPINQFKRCPWICDEHFTDTKEEKKGAA